MGLSYNLTKNRFSQSFRRAMTSVVVRQDLQWAHLGCIELKYHWPGQPMSNSPNSVLPTLHEFNMYYINSGTMYSD